jgi:hypothetical protein
MTDFNPNEFWEQSDFAFVAKDFASFVRGLEPDDAFDNE